MLWPFGSSCPVDDPSRRWLDAQLAWLAREFDGEGPVEQDLVLPTDACFPDPYDGSPAAVRRLFDRVRERMNVPAERVRLAIMDASRGPMLVNGDGDLMPTAAGLWEGGGGGDRTVVRLDRAQFARPMDLVGTIAHELSHERLLGEHRIDPDRFDNELLTDLTTVWLGFGIFLANSPRGDWKAIAGTWPGTDLRRPEYMTGPMLAYALARIAGLRFEERPAWATHMKWDARALFKQAMRWAAREERS
ncbi:MAG TPA: hypothetical protein VF796_10770 [Humisphaera sp.]